MRYFTIIRHAKSSWGVQGLSDHDRPLNDRGQRDAPRMARWLGRTLYKPETLVVVQQLELKKRRAIFKNAWK